MHRKTESCCEAWSPRERAPRMYHRNVASNMKRGDNSSTYLSWLPTLWVNILSNWSRRAAVARSCFSLIVAQDTKTGNWGKTWVTSDRTENYSYCKRALPQRLHICTHIWSRARHVAHAVWREVLCAAHMLVEQLIFLRETKTSNVLSTTAGKARRKKMIPTSENDVACRPIPYRYP